MPSQPFGEQLRKEDQKFWINSLKLVFTANTSYVLLTDFSFSLPENLFAEKTDGEVLEKFWE
jgi:hypothetical protein